MSEQRLLNVLERHATCVEACLQLKVPTAAMILIHSGLDTVGWLDSTEQYASPQAYKSWVDGYLLKAKPLGCTSLELYAARCGLLHTLTPDSKISNQGKARVFCYAWGEASLEGLQKSIDLMDLPSKCVAIHITDLLEGWRLGIRDWIQELDQDADRRERVYQKAKNFFQEWNVDMIPFVNELLNETRRDRSLEGPAETA